jgi:hypothetical protein
MLDRLIRLQHDKAKARARAQATVCFEIKRFDVVVLYHD